MQEHIITQYGNDLTRRWLKLVLALSAFLLFIFVIIPLPIKYIPAVKHYVETARENNISPGALYYTDVPVSGAAESNSRNTVRFYYNMQMADKKAD